MDFCVFRVFRGSFSSIRRDVAVSLVYYLRRMTPITQKPSTARPSALGETFLA